MKHRQTGVTLLELMVTLSIVGILAAISVTTYRSYSMRANRTEARTALLRIQVAQEKFFLQNNTYTTNLTAAAPNGLGMNAAVQGAGAVSPRGLYVITVAAGPTGLGTSFIASATAQATQVKDDPNCLVFTVDDSGNRTPDDTATGCWH